MALAVVNVQIVLYLCATFYNFLPYDSTAPIDSRAKEEEEQEEEEKEKTDDQNRCLCTFADWPLIIVLVIVDNYPILFCAAVLKWHLTKSL